LYTFGRFLLKGFRLAIYLAAGAERRSSPAAAATSEGALLAAYPSRKHDTRKPSWGKDYVDPKASTVPE